MRALKLSALALSCILAGCGGGGGGGGGSGGGFPVAAAPAPAPQAPATEPAPKPPAECSVTLYGDSILVPAAAELAKLRPKYRIVDKAVAGTKLASLDRTFANDWRNTRIVIIENGSIDAWHGTPASLLASTLGAMADYLRAEGRVTVITGPSHVAYFSGSLLPVFGDAGRAMFELEVKKLAADRGIAFADWGSVQFDGAADVPDGIHPRAAYSDRLVLRLAETLDRLAPECRE